VKSRCLRDLDRPNAAGADVRQLYDAMLEIYPKSRQSGLAVGGVEQLRPRRRCNWPSRVSTWQVPPPVNLSNHLPCTATTVTEGEMQHCSLIMKKRKRGPDVWLLRWSDKSDSGRRIYRKRVIGTVEEFVDAATARRAVASLVEKINGDNPRISLRTMTLSALCCHFERCELAQGNTWRSYSTKKCYAGYLKRWIVPQWGKLAVAAVVASRTGGRRSCESTSDPGRKNLESKRGSDGTPSDTRTRLF
jgi:hypothetical protein